MRNIFFVILGVVIAASCSGQERPRSRLHQKQAEVAESRPAYLYKVLSTDDWKKTCKIVHLSSMDADFIHFSTEEQLDKIIQKYWADASEYIVLKVETAKLPGDLVLEANPGGTTQYYHLYNGSIPLTGIVEMKLHKK